jgi:hypothetical protein
MFKGVSGPRKKTSKIMAQSGFAVFINWGVRLEKFI